MEDFGSGGLNEFTFFWLKFYTEKEDWLRLFSQPSEVGSAWNLSILFVNLDCSISLFSEIHWIQTNDLLCLTSQLPLYVEVEWILRGFYC